jgi:ribosomal protein S17E
MPGKTELARIHILKKEAALTDDEYRSLLSGAAGINSAADIETPDQYYKVVSTLEKYIASIGKTPSGRAANKRTLSETVLDRAKRILGPGYRNRIAGYLWKMGKTDLGDCSDRELRRVMGFLSSVEKRETETRTQNTDDKDGRVRQGGRS